MSLENRASQAVAHSKRLQQEALSARHRSQQLLETFARLRLGPDAFHLPANDQSSGGGTSLARKPSSSAQRQKASKSPVSA